MGTWQATAGALAAVDAQADIGVAAVHQRMLRFIPVLDLRHSATVYG